MRIFWKVILGIVLFFATMWSISHAFALMNASSDPKFFGGLGIVLLFVIVWEEFLYGGIRRAIKANRDKQARSRTRTQQRGGQS